MSPPGKKSGSTTKESVVKARLAPSICNIAESDNLFNVLLLKYLRNKSLIRSLVISPPLP
jgi:hypothetical protein